VKEITHNIQRHRHTERDTHNETDTHTLRERHRDRTVSNLVREMLNITDALLSDESQRKAAGKLVKRSIYDEMDYLRTFLVNRVGLPPSKGGANHNVRAYEREREYGNP